VLKSLFTSLLESKRLSQFQIILQVLGWGDFVCVGVVTQRSQKHCSWSEKVVCVCLESLEFLALLRPGEEDQDEVKYEEEEQEEEQEEEEELLSWGFAFVRIWRLPMSHFRLALPVFPKLGKMF